MKLNRSTLNAPITWQSAWVKFKVCITCCATKRFCTKPQGHTIQDSQVIKGLDNPELDEAIGSYAEELREMLELVQGASR